MDNVKELNEQLVEQLMAYDRPLKISAIIATGLNGEIGQDNDLPWHKQGKRLKKDFKRFKEISSFAPLIMGRKTWESIPNGLPGRQIIVLSRGMDETKVIRNDGCYAIQGGLQHLKDMLDTTDYRGEVIIAGGLEIYTLFNPLILRWYHTLVKQAFPDADTRIERFWENAQWKAGIMIHEVDDGINTVYQELFIREQRYSDEEM